MNVSKTNPELNNIAEEIEMAYLRADVCIASPQSFNLEEKQAICKGIDAANSKAEEAMRDDFQSWPPQAQVQMLDLLQKADPDHFDWWISTLAGNMPDSPSEVMR